MIIRLKNPTPESVRAILAARVDAPLTYDHEGVSRNDMSQAPAGFRLDRHAAVIGSGQRTFELAAKALEQGAHYPAPFTETIKLTGAVEPGQLFATVAHQLGFASIHPCRVLYVIREPTIFCYGFGTLPGHAESGEERFRVALHGAEVRYDIQAFSRPQGVLSSMVAPIVRHFQRRFFRDSVATMSALAAQY